MNISTVWYPPPAFPMTERPLSVITDCVIHHTAGNPNQSPQEIDSEHRALKPPDAMIAYNLIIPANGIVYMGRPFGFWSAASYGRNQQSVAVVLCGQFQKGLANYAPPTDAQIASLKDSVLYLHNTLPSITTTYGHGDIAKLFYDGNDQYATDCPGDDLESLIPEVLEYVRKNLVRH